MRRKNEAGQALVFTAVALVVLMGFAGLGIDMGVLRYERRLQQNAADAAALAGASNLGQGGVTSGAQAASAMNNFTDNTGGGACVTPPTNLAVSSVTVTVCNGPSTGPHKGDANYVEAFVTAGQPTYFMKLLGTNKWTISARAVATNVSGGTNGNSAGCLYTLGPPASSIEGVNINGNATLNAPTCGIVDNGNYNTKGNALTVVANTFGVSGSQNVSGPGGSVTCTGGTPTCPTYDTPAASDPLSYLKPPPVGTPVPWSGTPVPGTTYSAIDITSTGTVNFPAGTYVMDGGNFTCHGTPTITGIGVTFYFTNGATFNCSGDDTVQLTAPSSGPYAGILFYQDPNDSAGPSVGGNTGTFYNGILYFPKAQITFFGNNTSIATGIVVADAVSLSGHPTVTLGGAASVPGGLPPGFSVSAILVE